MECIMYILWLIPHPVMVNLWSDEGGVIQKSVNEKRVSLQMLVRTRLGSTVGMLALHSEGVSFYGMQLTHAAVVCWHGGLCQWRRNSAQFGPVISSVEFCSLYNWKRLVLLKTWCPTAIVVGSFPAGEAMLDLFWWLAGMLQEWDNDKDCWRIFCMVSDKLAPLPRLSGANGSDLGYLYSTRCNFD